jgi:hypothetical protein
MSNIPLKVEKYLQKFGTGKRQLNFIPREKINNAIVIPAISEFENLKRLLNSLCENDPKYFKSSLIIIVINNLESSSREVKADNQKSILLFKQLFQKNNLDNDSLIEKVLTSGLYFAFVDASSNGKELPEKDGGVGLARKIGMDLALTAFDYPSSSKKLIFCLDADCTVDKNYIANIVVNFNSRNLSAAVVNFRHQIEPGNENAEAIICYEIFLRYYVLGLKFANSHYAFHTIGSTIICDYESYIKAGGMNKQKAAEDFYFLEKLAKNINVDKIEDTTVYPSSRKSWRVPFGTGQRVTRFLQKVQNEYLLYNPESFYILKQWLKIFNGEENFNSSEYLYESKKINIELYNFLIEQNFLNDWEKILLNSKTKDQIYKQKIRWFDGFRTLKLIHYLRDKSYPLMNMFDALDEMLKNFDIEPIERNGISIPPVEIQIKYLEALRKLT